MRRMCALISAAGLAACLLASAAPQAEGGRPGLVVVAPKAWEAALRPFAEARARDGLAVAVLALEELAGDPGADAPERLKRALYAAWRERGARYVLLCGDADVVPVRFMTLDRATAAAHDTAFYASDLYYADVADAGGAFEGWNARTDGHHAGYFGEVHGETHKRDAIDQDGVDYLPELAVGRWPVSTEEELRAVSAKTLAYGAGAAEPSVLAVHAAEWVDARPLLGRLCDGLAGAGFAVERQLYGAEDGLPTTASVRAALLARPGLALHVGHGTNESWHLCLGEEDRAALASAAPSVFLSVGCSTAHLCTEPPYLAYLDVRGAQHRGTNDGELFTGPPPPPAPLQPGRFNSTGLGERLLRSPAGGAVVYIGCGTGAQPCALTLLEGFAEALAAAPDARLGDAWNGALRHYHARERLSELVPTDSWYPPSVFFQGMKFLFLGDPTLRLTPRR
jgi:hypothetical protein